MDYSAPGSSVHGIFQARVLEWVAISFSRYLPDPGIKPVSLPSPALTGEFFTSVPPGTLNQPGMLINTVDPCEHGFELCGPFVHRFSFLGKNSTIELVVG